MYLFKQLIVGGRYTPPTNNVNDSRAQDCSLLFSSSFLPLLIPPSSVHFISQSVSRSIPRLGSERCLLVASCPSDGTRKSNAVIWFVRVLIRPAWISRS